MNPSQASHEIGGCLGGAVGRAVVDEDEFAFHARGQRGRGHAVEQARQGTLFIEEGRYDGNQHGDQPLRSIHNHSGANGSRKRMATVVTRKARRTARTIGRLAGAAIHAVEMRMCQ